MTRFFGHGQSILQVFETPIALSMMKSVKSKFFPTLLVIGGSRGGLGARAPPLDHLKFSFFYLFVGIRVLPNWLIDSCISREMSECVV